MAKQLRLLSKVLLALIIVGGGIYLASCLLSGPAGLTLTSDKTSPPVTLRLWHYYNGATKEAFDRQIQTFNETEGQRQGIIVQSFTMGDVARLAQAVKDSAATKPGSLPLPDIFATYTQTLLGLPVPLLEISSLLPPEKLIQFKPDILTDGYICPSTPANQAALPGQAAPPCGLYVLPTSKSTEVLYVNKTAWDDFALATDTDLMSLSTWEGLTEAAKRYHTWTDSLTAKQGDGKSLFRFDSSASFVSALYAQTVGRKSLSTAPFPASVEQALASKGIPLPAVAMRPYPAEIDITFARMLWRFYHVPFVSGHYGMKGRFCSDDVKTGTIIAYTASSAGGLYFPATVEMMPGQNTSITASVLPYPALAGKQTAAIRQGAGLSVIAGSAQSQQAAIKFLTWLTAPENNIAFALDTGYLPVVAGTLDEETRQHFAAIPSAPAQHAKHSLLGNEYAKTLAAETYTVAGLAVLTAMDMAEQDMLLADAQVENAQYLLPFWDTFFPEQVEAALRERNKAEQAGMSRAEALEILLSEKRFEQWYQALQTGMTKALAPTHVPQN